MAVTAQDHLLIERQLPIVTVTINRPRQRNAKNNDIDILIVQVSKI